jgi:membrane-associated phospholipid phosphatase
LTFRVTAVITLVIMRATAHAQPAEPVVPSGPPSSSTLRPSYVYDGGAIPFFWLPLIGAIAADRWLEPRKTPLYFSRLDGGATPAAWENPGWTVHVAALGLGASMIAGGEASRWYHAKGLAQALATSSLVVSVVKPLVGRHRPDWAEGLTESGDVKSFPSGHTTTAFAVATYAALYLHGRVFDDNTSGWAKGAAYTGIFLGASLVAGERVYHARHHLSDVIAGAVIGSASSYAMFRFQDYRFRNRALPDGGGLQITPSVTSESAVIGLSGAF